jgi:TolB-like protein/DNA-binding winged helix-turn-helix (wHTH) protein/Flp pilus assembly protein TadD
MQSNGHKYQSIRFGPFELKLKSGELCRDGATVKLPPQPFKVLSLLAENAGQLVTREEIQQQVWGTDTFVDFDKGLNFCIKQIREALGDNAQSPQYIETLPRRGYRFIAPVENIATIVIPSHESAEPQKLQSTHSAPSAAAAPGKPLRIFQWRTLGVALLLLLPLVVYFFWQRFASQARPPAKKIMLAVLPFENLNGDTAEDYFSDGLTEEMITQIGGLRPERLSVIARTTSLTYKNAKKDIRQIGRELGVSYVLEGSVRREADRVRITVQLIQVSDQTHLWAETYERNERDMLQLQSDVANRVARSLALELLPVSSSDSIEVRSSNPEAYEAYLKGRYLVTKDTLPDLERSIPYFDQAAEKDPNFAPAYAAATDARVLLTTWNNTSALEALSKAKADALKSVELNPAFAEAHAALGSVNFYFEWNWPEAEANIKRAIELNPSNPNIHILYADYLISQGQRRAARSHIEQAIQLDPVSLLTNGLSAYAYLRARQYDEAIAQAKRMIELEPKSPAAHYCLISAYNFKGMYEEARDLILKRMVEEAAEPKYIDALKQGDAKEAVERLERRQFEGLKEALSKGEKINATWVAQVSAKMGDKDMAFEWLEKAYAERLPSLVYLNIHPVWDSLHQDPRFADLARRLGLTP